MDSFNSGRAADRFLSPREGQSRGFPVARIVRVAICAVLYGLFYFVQQVTELLAPLVLILGVGWSALPHIVGAIGASAASADPQTRDIVTHVAGTIPRQIVIGAHVVTADSLVADGLLMMAAAALCATLAAVAAREM
ncbi:hypothetical protein ACLRDC_09305 [Gluconacetobacter sacchari]|uniref:Uncharacterized protein n=2 Tax=Gluconacetobacter sacchari TaxID=92759 RepID=A0A7W4IFW6_9PROT|nr:hypothetical protein [Gluconacetobacter sacchari]MBB2162138.1 hypothetical protein [Gluconacetobacter sacchari]GBQ30641.1 hypothetical protein AA12717_3544 [Gluconacetobacter sacchari DSM 12717]